MATFTETLQIENACETCPLRNIINCDQARLIGEATGLGFRTGASVTQMFEDEQNRRASVIVTQAPIVLRSNPKSPELYSDSTMDRERVTTVNQQIQACTGSQRQGLLRRIHCVGGFSFRVVKQAEFDEMKRMRGHSGFIRGPLTKFKTY